MMIVNLILTLFFSTQIYADIVLSEVILDFKDKQTIRKDVTVENVGSEKKYIAVETAVITNPGLDPVVRKKVKNPLEANLVVTPNKLILAPKQKRNLRFIIKSKPATSDEIYRVRVVPKLGKVSLKGKGKKDNKKTGVKVVVGYDVLVMNRPTVPKTSYQIKRIGNKLTITNNGNTNFLIRSITQCDDEERKKGCEKSSGFRMYAGRTRDFSLNKKTTAEVALKFFNNNKIELY